MRRSKCPVPRRFESLTEGLERRTAVLLDPVLEGLFLLRREALDLPLESGEVQEENVEVADRSKQAAEPFQLSFQVSGRALGDRAAKKPQGGTHPPGCDPRLVHELRVDIALHAGKLFAKPLELVGEDLPNGEVEAVVESNPAVSRAVSSKGS